MRKHLDAPLTWLAALLFLGQLACSSPSGLTIGFSPTGLPITLCASESGITVQLGRRIHTPIGTFSIGVDLADAIRLNRHTTYVELLNRRDGSKTVFELSEIGERFQVNTAYAALVRIENRRYSTIVTVDSEDVSQYLHIAPSVRPKPTFPETPVRYFALYRSTRVDWSVRGFSIGGLWDLVANLLWVVLLAVLLFIDLCVMAILFVLRLCWFICLLLAYFVQSMRH